MNACAWKFLLTHQELIPKEWKGKNIIFWGTVFYHNFSGVLVVPGLYWRQDVNRWEGYFASLDDSDDDRYFYSDDCSIILK